MYLINLIDFCKYMRILILMPAACFKHVGTKATKDRKSLFADDCNLFLIMFHTVTQLFGIAVVLSVQMWIVPIFSLNFLQDTNKSISQKLSFSFNNKAAAAIAQSLTANRSVTQLSRFAASSRAGGPAGGQSRTTVPLLADLKLVFFTSRGEE